MMEGEVPLINTKEIKMEPRKHVSTKTKSQHENNQKYQKLKVKEEQESDHLI